MSDGMLGYWPNETSGALAPVVRKYIEGGTLDGSEVAIMRAYLRQWMGGVWSGPAAKQLRADVDRIFTHAELRAWLDRAVDEGIDPL